MLALTVLGLLALAPADTVVRVPGTALRFGLADTLVAARGFAPAADGAREGRCRFFGMDGAARLRFADGRLARAEFTVERASPRQRDYVQDQLAAMGYRRSCAKLLPAASDCEWTGRTRVRLTVTGAVTPAVYQLYGVNDRREWRVRLTLAGSAPDADGSLMAVWTQSQEQPGPKNCIVFSRSEDNGKTWAAPSHVAGPNGPDDPAHMASWAFPMVSKRGRIYVVYNQHQGISGWIPMPTGTPTRTATPTPTATSTRTPLPTFTNTPTFGPSPTYTVTLTKTPRPPTATPTVTFTRMPTYTNTPITPTNTKQPTNTPSP